MTTFADRLQRALDVLGVGVVELDTRIAAIRGTPVNRGYTTKTLKGRLTPLEFAEAMALGLGVRPAWLLLGDGEMMPDAKTQTYGELPGWRVVAAGAVELLPRGVPPYAIEAASRRPVLAHPKALNPAFVVALADFWFRFASDAEVEAAEEADTKANRRR